MAPLSPALRELLDDCVHCGFCLPTCPTYLLWGQETDSPRGRIHLMRLRRDGRESNPQSFVEHIDTCLGCMACVTACPSGVQYDSLLEAARPEVERLAHRGLGDRLFRRAIFEMFRIPAGFAGWPGRWASIRNSGLQTLVHASGILKLLPSGCRRWSGCCRRSRLTRASAAPCPSTFRPKA